MAQTQQRKNNRRLMILYVAVSIVVLLGSVIPLALPRDDIVSGNGTITFVPQSGGFYGIISDGGIQYDPLNLGTSLDQSNLRVNFEGKIRTDVANAHQWGTMLELTKINPLP